jgi:hypothetical protein
MVDQRSTVTSVPSRLWITLNARLRPLDRGSRYEDPLEEVLTVRAPGCAITGGGTQLGVDREPVFSDIDLEVEGDPDTVRALVIATLEAAGAPKGSRARSDSGEVVFFGVSEGLAIYLNGTDLTDEVYANSDGNAVIAALDERLGPDGSVQSYWEGPRETALYLYGHSAARMADLIVGVLARFPEAERCRIVPLDLSLPPQS